MSVYNRLHNQVNKHHETNLIFIGLKAKVRQQKQENQNNRSQMSTNSVQVSAQASRMSITCNYLYITKENLIII